MVGRHHDVWITGCLREVLMPSTSLPASAGEASPQPAHTHFSAVQLPKKVGCHSQCRGEGRQMGRRGEWKTGGSDRGSSGKLWRNVQFELAKPTHLSAAARHSRPKSYRMREMGLSHQIRSSALSCITSSNTWQSDLFSFVSGVPIEMRFQALPF